MWVAAQIGYNIGHQRTEQCLFDEETKLPMLEYKGYVIFTRVSPAINVCYSVFLWPQHLLKSRKGSTAISK